MKCNDVATMPPEVREVISRHREAVVICADPVNGLGETGIGAYVKMLDKNKGGELASVLTQILQNLKASYSEKHSGATYQPPTDTQEASC